MPESFAKKLLTLFLVNAAFIFSFHLSVDSLIRPALAYEFWPSGWPEPKLYGAERVSDEKVDFDPKFPGKETRLEKFHTPDGGRVFRFSHKGNVFSFEIDSDLEDPLDYEIVDKDGSGAFEIKQSPYNEYPLPRWTYE